MQDIKQLESQIEELINKAIDNNQMDVIIKLMARLQFDYCELAMVATDGNYHENWKHSDVLDYVTFEGSV